MMPKSIDLLSRALAQVTSERALSRELGLTPTVINNAKTRGHLSPAMAAVLARFVGEDDEQAARWTLLAVAENERSAKLRPQLESIARGLKSYFRRVTQSR